MSSTSTTASTSGSNTASGSSSSAGSFISIPQTAAAGGVSFTEPKTTSSAFYKIASDSPITFGWNFTSLIISPTSLTISAIGDNGRTYPVGPTDGVIAGDATQVVWDVYSYQQANPGNPLAVATYTLTMWDERGPTATRAGGMFNPTAALQFALCTPQSYTPIASGKPFNMYLLLYPVI